MDENSEVPGDRIPGQHLKMILKNCKIWEKENLHKSKRKAEAREDTKVLLALTKLYY